MPGKAQPQKMAVDPLQFVNERADVERALRHDIGLTPQEILDCQTIGIGVAGRTNSADTFHQIRHLIKMLILRQLLDTAVVVTDDDIDIYHPFALDIKLEKFRLFL